MPSDWNQIPAFGKKRGSGASVEFLPLSPAPPPPAFGQRDAERDRSSTDAGLPAGGLVRGPLRAGGAAAHPGLFGKSVCNLTYRGSVAPEAVLAGLTPESLGDRLTGRVTGNPRSGYLLLPLRSGGVVVSAVPAPLSLPDDDPAQYAAWPNWRSEIAEWRSHVSIAAFGEARSTETARDCAEEVVLVARLLAGMTGSAAAAVWPASGVTMPAPAFVRQAGRTQLPVELLVRCVARHGSGPATARTGVTTRGLHLFGLPEIDHPPGSEPVVVMCERVLALAAHLLAEGEAPEDEGPAGGGAIGHRVRPANDADGLPVLVIVPRVS
jgi:hypothetical protein